MSTLYDIKDAKADYEQHNHTHRCTASDYSSRRCPGRTAAWVAYMRVADRWGLPEDGESYQDRQARQHHERVPNSPA